MHAAGVGNVPLNKGIQTTIPLHRRILRDEDFKAGSFDTRFVECLLAKMKKKVRGEAGSAGK